MRRIRVSFSGELDREESVLTYRINDIKLLLGQNGNIEICLYVMNYVLCNENIFYIILIYFTCIVITFIIAYKQTNKQTINHRSVGVRAELHQK